MKNIYGQLSLKLGLKKLGIEVTEPLFRDIVCEKLTLLMRYS